MKPEIEAAVARIEAEFDEPGISPSYVKHARTLITALRDTERDAARHAYVRTFATAEGGVRLKYCEGISSEYFCGAALDADCDRNIARRAAIAKGTNHD